MTPELVIDLLNTHLDAPPFLGAEVGVSEGRTSAALLKAFPTLTLYMIDAWATYDRDHPYYKSGDGHARLTQTAQNAHKSLAIGRTRFAENRRHILHMTSAEAARELGNRLLGPHQRLLDFGIIDADHTEAAVRQDIYGYLPSIRPGGVMLGDDIDHPRDKRGLFGVRKAVEGAFGEDGFQQIDDVWFVIKCCCGHTGKLWISNDETEYGEKYSIGCTNPNCPIETTKCSTEEAAFKLWSEGCQLLHVKEAGHATT